MNEPTAAGAFRLLEQVGRGEVGIVWRAEHVRYPVPAAVKVVNERHASDASFTAQFRQGVETAASLSHPGIAMVFDHGVLSGAPYMAMEWASGGTLADIVPIAGWAQVRDIVLEILAALAHAHAHGVVHGDLKPQNVLVGDRGRLMLSDFGLGAGSPRWMAPEQIRGSIRDQGPWTDLYSMGCLVFWLLTYRPPYHTGSESDIEQAHVTDPIPRLRSRIAVPHDIESWLRRLLAKDPSDRYRYAADAAHDLAQFSDRISTPIDDGELGSPHEAETIPEELLEDELFGDELEGLEEPSSYALFETSATPIRLDPRPLPPRSWAAAEPAQAPMAVVGAGLGLFGLRPVSMVDRESERELLWSVLRDVHRAREPRAVVIWGGTGIGKSRLARWLGERARELGAAHVMSASTDQLRSAVTQWFRVDGLDADATRLRIEAEFEALQHDQSADVATLAELDDEQWFDAWLRYLARATRDRPMIMVLDDAQSGGDSFRLVERVLAQRHDLALLFVLTVSKTAAVLDHEAVQELIVGPLDAAHQHELLTRSLHLDPSLAEEVAAQSAGNPRFAVEFTREWVQRGWLEMADHGLVRAEGAPRELPRADANE